MTRAFTLAEVLITLGIIGVVAVLTMPPLIAKYQKKETAVRLVKTYAELSQAVKLSEIDNDIVDNWNYSLGAQAFFDKYLKNYMKKVTILPSSKWKSLVSYKMLNGTAFDNSCLLYDVSTIGVMLSNGTIMYIIPQTTQFKLIYIDINGLNPPNKYGKDLFSFSIQPTYGLVPYGFGTTNSSGDTFGTEYNRAILIGTSNSACKKSGTGTWCAALIRLDGWEIKNDYPW